MVSQYEIILSPYKRGFHLITSKVLEKLKELPQSGICNVFIHHTSAALTINENADASVRADFETFFNAIVPDAFKGFTHILEGSDDMSAHIKASILGYSVTIPIENSKLKLGTWQGIYLCEFRNDASSRKITVTIIS
ncbi:MAG: YjbQ family protein [Bacteroidales bacterium]|nr:YjbQ family protein [Bacteroidales bacterium]